LKTAAGEMIFSREPGYFSMRLFPWVPGIALVILVLLAGCVSPETEPSAPSASPAVSSLATPSTVSTGASAPIPTTINTPDPLGDSPTMVTVKTITGGSGTQSVNVTVPGYWEMWYTADPLVTGGQDSHSATGINSAVFPTLSVVIRDAASGEEIETVEPPGGLDTYLWQRAGDPRPWSKKFYRGNMVYALDITARHLKSYMIEIRVPKS
jgi:hypothetical protein